MNAIFIGRRSQGKSTLAVYVAERAQERIGAHIIPAFDPKRTFRCVPHTNNPEEFAKMLISPGPKMVAYQPFASSNDVNRDGSVWDEFSTFCDLLGIEKHLGDEKPSRPELGAVIVLVDEAWLLQRGQSIHPWLEKLVRLADYKKFFLFQLAHRPGDISPSIRAQADEFFFFRQWLASDIEIIEEMAGPEVAEAVAQLPDHHVIRFEVSTGQFELWNEPKNWYRDISQECQKGESDGIADASGSGENGSGEGSGEAGDNELFGNDEGAAGHDGSAAESDGCVQQSR